MLLATNSTRSGAPRGGARQCGGIGGGSAVINGRPAGAGASIGERTPRTHAFCFGLRPVARYVRLDMDSSRRVRARVVTTHLEFDGGADPAGPAAAARLPYELRRSRGPSPEYSRFLYRSVGGGWYWLSRIDWPRERWLAYLSRPELETWVAYVAGAPAGYFELEAQAAGAREIVLTSACCRSSSAPGLAVPCSPTRCAAPGRPAPAASGCTPAISITRTPWRTTRRAVFRVFKVEETEGSSPPPRPTTGRRTDGGRPPPRRAPPEY